MASLNNTNPMKTLTIMILLFCTINCSCFGLPSPRIKMSTISAEPALLPFPPASSPAPETEHFLSPDISPLFPTPVSGSSPPPTDSSLPVIPSSPSPPNPDSLSSPDHPEFGISPIGFMPESSAFGLAPLNMGFLLLFFIALFMVPA